MSRIRVHNLAVSLDGFGAGEDPTLESPFGHAGMRLMEWFLATPSFQRVHLGTEPEPTPAIEADDAFARRNLEGIGAHVMGSRMFGLPGWQDDPEWRGWWGEEPPYGTPVYVLTHRPRPDLVLGRTTFHFVDAPAGEVARQAREAAAGLDVQVSGGPTTVREFLDADLVDTMHVVVVPIVLGRGSSLWAGQEGLEERFDIRSTTTPSGVTHHEFTRRGR
ncbi:dihydrofolate reductase family protein [Pseudolysinimonas kribbensis]|uniref:dihydrofolate reductase family protein n=1 Tax=Pseudolysinimonas kribbensis TaxID=433641 RepID=UPI0031DAD3A1